MSTSTGPIDIYRIIREEGAKGKKEIAIHANSSVATQHTHKHTQMHTMRYQFYPISGKRCNLSLCRKWIDLLSVVML